MAWRGQNWKNIVDMSSLTIEGYCLKCKEKRIIANGVAEWSATGRPATRGSCAVCGSTIYRQGRTVAHDSLPKLESPAGNGADAEAKSSKPVAKKPAHKAPAPQTKAKKPTTNKKATPGRSKSAATPAANVRRSGKLVVVESPAKAKTIGKYLGKGYVVKSSVGHVRDLLKSRLSVDVEDNFRPDYRVPTDKKETVKGLREAAAKANEIYLATDPDREGEAIAWHVLEAAEMEPARTRRVVFQEITKPAIQAAFQNPREIDMDRVNAQQARRIVDRLVGYKLSPLLWRKVRGRLSAGRVQSVAVRLVVEREREIEQFQSVEYWTIAAQLSQLTNRSQKSRPYFVAQLHQIEGKEPGLSNEAQVKPHLAALEKSHWQVGEVRLGQRKRRPAAPFTTSTLQQEASRRLGNGTTKTMRLAQGLYEGVDLGSEGSVGLITYMRTDSVNVAQEAQQEARRYLKEQFGEQYVPERPPIYKTRSKLAQEAHEAIRPTSIFRTPEKMKEYLSRDQFRLYQLIWQRFVASQMASAEYDTVSADIHVGPAAQLPVNRPYLFRAVGSTLRFAGFLALYEETEPSDRPDDGENRVPAGLTTGEILDLLRLLPEQHFTQPPPRFSEATLVKELEENGIGRPSTYASIITTIQDRGYVEIQEKRLVPTETGQIVNDLLVKHFPDLLSVDFTARLEDELDEIAEGRAWTPVIANFYHGFAKELELADEAIPKLNLKSEPDYVGRDCPECGKALVYRDSRYGRFIGCGNFPKCRFTEQILSKIGVACPKDGGELVEKRTKTGRVFYGCANYPACDWTSWKKPLPQPCRLCGKTIVQVDRHTAECLNCGERQPLSKAKTVAVP